MTSARAPDSPRPAMDFDALGAAFLDPSSTIAAVQLVAGKQVSELSNAALGAMVHAHLLARGLLGSTLKTITGKIIEYDEAQSTREARIAAFVIGEPLCVTAIMEGRYIQASALVRQELESVAALHEQARGRRKDGWIPNVGVLEPSLRRLYGPLSDAAHLASDWIVEAATKLLNRGSDLPSDHAATRHYPEFDEQLCRRQFALHVFLLTQVAAEFASDAEKYHGVEPSQLLLDGFDAVIQLLIDEGMLEQVEDPHA